MGGARRAVSLDLRGRWPTPDEGEDGFTLVELMTVLLILAILLSIALPVFLGTTAAAQDRSAQSDLTNAVVAAKSIYYNANGSYPSTAQVVSGMSASEPEFTFTAGATPSGQTNQITIGTYAGKAVVLGIWSKSDRCWWAIDNPNATAITAGPMTIPPGTSYNESAADPDQTSCDVTSVSSFVADTWPLSYPAPQ
jgi:prepilin-type N-terminal cleavage/methylation domain-containing protein